MFRLKTEYLSLSLAPISSMNELSINQLTWICKSYIAETSILWTSEECHLGDVHVIVDV